MLKPFHPPPSRQNQTNKNEETIIFYNWEGWWVKSIAQKIFTVDFSNDPINNLKYPIDLESSKNPKKMSEIKIKSQKLQRNCKKSKNFQPIPKISKVPENVQKSAQNPARISKIPKIFRSRTLFEKWFTPLRREFHGL